MWGIGINPVIKEGRTFTPPPAEQPAVSPGCSLLHLIAKQVRLQHLSPTHTHPSQMLFRRERQEGNYFCVRK